MPVQYDVAVPGSDGWLVSFPGLLRTFPGLLRGAIGANIWQRTSCPFSSLVECSAPMAKKLKRAVAAATKSAAPKKLVSKKTPTRKSSPASSKKPAAKTAGRSSAARGKTARYWLVKSEPDAFSIDDLARSKKQTTHWDGVRNYQARNILRDEMRLGDLVLFYHSNAKPPGIAGVTRVVAEGYPDHTAFDPQDKHYDPKSKRGDPTWYMVDLQLVEKFPNELGLPQLKEVPALSDMMLLRRGARLSVQPVAAAEFKTILKLAKQTS